MFAAILFEGTRKVTKLEKDGIREFLVREARPRKTKSDNGDGRIAGLIENLAVMPGIYMFREDGLYAIPERLADDVERTEMFRLFKQRQVGVFPVAKTSIWFVLPTNFNRYVKGARLLPLLFAPDNISLLDPLLARVYKRAGRSVLIYEDANVRYPLEVIDELRSHFDDPIPSKPVGASKELVQAYDFVIKSREPVIEKLVKHAFDLAEATFVSVEEMGSGRYKVVFKFRGEEHKVTINDQLTILDAGICLSGKQREQDLSSIPFILERKPDWVPGWAEE